MVKVTAQDRGEIVVFRCKGRMVVGEDTRALSDGVCHAHGKRLIVLDLAEMEAMDARGLGLLVYLYRSAALAGMELKLTNPTRTTRTLLAITNLDSVLEIWRPQDVEWRPDGRLASISAVITATAG